MPMKILVIDDESGVRRNFQIFLQGQGHTVVAVGRQEEALAEVQRETFDVALLDMNLGRTSGLDLIGPFRATAPWMRILLITGCASVESAVKAMRMGAYDYVVKPLSFEELRLALEKVDEVRLLEQRVTDLQSQIEHVLPELDFESTAPSMQRVYATARQVARSNATVLLRGESGTGKTCLARALHTWSGRMAAPFGVVSCPSLSGELLESELFGYRKGSFTGAVRDYPGRISACDGGTLFLDAIGDLPLTVQPKLLRFLQERVFERLGEVEPLRADVRVITATNRDLAAAVTEGRFREDLLFRLNVIEIVMPPLRDRTEDIVPIARRMLSFFARENHRVIHGFSSEAEKLMVAYEWPGNLRELRNAVERAVVLCTDDEIGLEYLPILQPAQVCDDDLCPGDNVTLQRLEELHIRRVLARTPSIEAAAEILGMDTVTLWRRRKQYGLLSTAEPV